MFDPPPDVLLREVQEAEKVRDEHLTGINRLIKEYVGRWYRGSKDVQSVVQGLDDTDNNPEPYSYSYVTNMLPALIFDNPSVNVKARRTIGYRVVQEAMKNGLRGWIEDVDYQAPLEQVILDMLFFRGVLMHYIEDDTRWSDGAVRPNCCRIPYQNFFLDSMTRTVGEDEFMGHKFYVDKEDLLADPDALPEIVGKLKNYDTDLQDKGDPYRKGDLGTTGRNRVCLRSVWQRRTNKIRVIAEIGKGEEAYPPREWYGPKKTGPYTLFDAYPVPNQAYPLSPLIAVQDQVIDLQTHARAASRGAAGRKTVIIVDGTHANLPEDIKDASDREVIGVPGFSSSQLQQIELGGVTQQQYEYLAYQKARLDRHSGLTETSRGNTDAGTTATADTIASEALNNRTEYLKARVRRAAKQSLNTIGWFLFHTTGIIIPVSVRDPITGMDGEGLFFGGPVPGMEAGTWDDYEINIEPFSMGRTSEATTQRRAMDWANFLIQVAPMIPQMPYLRWQDILKSVGEAMNQDNADNAVVWELVGMMSRPDMQPVSGELGAPPDQQGRYFSMPPYGFKPMNGGPGSASNAPMVDNRRQEFGKQFGPMGGGKQGPPGSAGTGSLMSGAYR